MAANDRAIKVAELKPGEAGKGVARLDPELMDILGIKVGDIVIVTGNKKTAVKVLRGAPEDANRGIIRLDGSTRRNAGVSIDERVDVKKAEVKEAEKITFSPTDELRLQGGEEYLAQVLEGRAFAKGDVLSLNIMGNKMDLVVTSFNPGADAALMTSQTKVKISDKPISKENMDIPKVSYDDIGGLGPVIGQIREMIELPLKHPELFKRLGVEAPKGVLLHGPPGTGKTMLAKAVAGETSSNFISIGGPEIMSKFYGESEGKLREIFKEAEENSPSIIFIDEIDSIAPKRSEVQGEEERRIVAQLLSLMDGLNARGKVVVIGATNRPNSIDEALRRPGRFDREIEIGVPDRHGRLEILQIHTRGMPLDKDVDLGLIADKTHGYVGADLAALCREAAMKCLARHMDRFDLEKPVPTELLEKMRVDMDDFLRAFSEVEPSGMREVSVEIPKITWDDIGGLDGIRNELREVLLPGEEKKDFERLGISAGKGVLLYGPPGTGKTLIAKAVANESGSNFILVNGPELMNKYVGQSEENLRKVFKRARQMAPSVIFFDELDSLAPRRNGEESSRAADNMVAQLLTALDGVEQLNNVLVVAATNRPDMVDPAVLRPGRIDRMILVGKPDTGARLGILKVHTKKMPLGKDVDLAHIAEVTDGYVGADLFSLCREAGLNAYREDHAIESVCLRHFEKAMEIVRPSVDDMTYKAYTEMASKARNNRDRWSNTQFYS